MQVFDHITTPFNLLMSDADFKTMRKDKRGNQELFDETYNEAMDLYIKGDWEEAQKQLSKCKELNPKDGPTMTLSHYIQSLNNTAPSTWKGYRELTSK